MKKLFPLCLIIIGACASVQYVAPISGETATVVISAPGIKYLSSNTVSIGIADENGCSETLAKVTEPDKPITVPANTKLIFNVLNVIGQSRCHNTQGVIFEPNREYIALIDRSVNCSMAIGVPNPDGSLEGAKFSYVKPYKFAGGCATSL